MGSLQTLRQRAQARMQTIQTPRQNAALAPAGPAREARFRGPVLPAHADMEKGERATCKHPPPRGGRASPPSTEHVCGHRRCRGRGRRRPRRRVTAISFPTRRGALPGEKGKRKSGRRPHSFVSESDSVSGRSGHGSKCRAWESEDFPLLRAVLYGGTRRVRDAAATLCSHLNKGEK